MAVILFGVAAGGALVAGVFPMDYPGPPTTKSGKLHQLGGVLTFIPCLIAMLCFSLSARRDHTWRWLKKPLVVLSLAGFAAFGLVILSNSMLGYMGFAQRILMTVLLAWLGAISIGLIRIGNQGTSSSSVTL